MRYIYVDEAGTSANEPVTVVIGVIVEADRQWKRALAELERVKEVHTPPELKSDFIFHAKDIWSGYRKLDATWGREQRADFIADVGSIPRRLGMAISMGKVRRDWDFDFGRKAKKADIHHMVAFWRCLGRANKFVRDNGHPDEIATVVAEDVREKRRILKSAWKLPAPDIPLTPEFVTPQAYDREAGRIVQTNSGPVDRIVDTVHFVEKGDGPLLQIADACAFSFRRYFAAQDHGERLVTEILGFPLVWNDWQGPMSEEVIGFRGEQPGS